MNAPALVWREEDYSHFADSNGFVYEATPEGYLYIIYPNGGGTSCPLDSVSIEGAKEEAQLHALAISSAVQSECAWVKCAERLPEIATPVLISRIFTSPEVSRDTQPHIDCRYDTGFTYKVVTHWMPLPAPPIQEEK